LGDFTRLLHSADWRSQEPVFNVLRTGSLALSLQLRVVQRHYRMRVTSYLRRLGQSDLIRVPSDRFTAEIVEPAIELHGEFAKSNFPLSDYLDEIAALGADPHCSADRLWTS
jgi:hypothetical protein